MLDNNIIKQIKYLILSKIGKWTSKVLSSILRCFIILNIDVIISMFYVSTSIFYKYRWTSTIPNLKLSLPQSYLIGIKLRYISPLSENMNWKVNLNSIRHHQNSQQKSGENCITKIHMLKFYLFYRRVLPSHRTVVLVGSWWET